MGDWKNGGIGYIYNDFFINQIAKYIITNPQVRRCHPIIAKFGLGKAELIFKTSSSSRELW